MDKALADYKKAVAKIWAVYGKDAAKGKIKKNKE